MTTPEPNDLLTADEVSLLLGHANPSVTRGWLRDHNVKPVGRRSLGRVPNRYRWADVLAALHAMPRGPYRKTPRPQREDQHNGSPQTCH